MGRTLVVSELERCEAAFDDRPTRITWINVRAIAAARVVVRSNKRASAMESRRRAKDEADARPFHAWLDANRAELLKRLPK